VKPISPVFSVLLRVVIAQLRALVAVFVILDEIARPIYGPVSRWFSSLTLVHRAESFIAGLPPYVVLAILGVPVVGVEPLKLLGLLWLSSGRWVSGLALLGVAYGASFLIVERIYDAGRDKLMQIGWFCVAMGFVTSVRNKLVNWAKGTAVWVFARRLAGDVKLLRQRLTLGVRQVLNRRA
jgi:hypothetical protein